MEVSTSTMTPTSEMLEQAVNAIVEASQASSTPAAASASTSQDVTPAVSDTTKQSTSSAEAAPSNKNKNKNKNGKGTNPPGRLGVHEKAMAVQGKQTWTTKNEKAIEQLQSQVNSLSNNMGSITRQLGQIVAALSPPRTSSNPEPRKAKGKEKVKEIISAPDSGAGTLVQNLTPPPPPGNPTNGLGTAEPPVKKTPEEHADALLKFNLGTYKIKVHNSLEKKLKIAKAFMPYKAHFDFSSDRGIGADGQPHPLNALMRVLTMLDFFQYCVKMRYRKILSLYGHPRDITMLSAINANVPLEFQLQMHVMVVDADNKDSGRWTETLTANYGSLTEALTDTFYVPDVILMFNVYSVTESPTSDTAISMNWMKRVVEVAPTVWIGHFFDGPLGSFYNESLYFVKDGKVQQWSHVCADRYKHAVPYWLYGAGFDKDDVNGNIVWYTESKPGCAYVQVRFSNQ